MSRLTTLVAVAMLLAGGMLAISPDAAGAAPAVHYSYADCSDDIVSEDIYVYCYQADGVVKVNETPSGIFQYHDKGTDCYQYYLNGDVVEEGCSRYNIIEIATDFITPVYHYRGTFEYTSGGVTCTVVANNVYANGEARHEYTDVQCSS